MSAWGAFVAGTDTGVGKTRVTVALLHALGGLGVRAAGMKPVASGTEADGQNEDVRLLRAASAAAGIAPALLQQLNPYCFPWPISPHLAARRAGVLIDVLRIRQAYRELSERSAAVLVEGAGGWLAPINEQQTMADVARVLQLPVVLVVGLRLGCLNHALLSAQAVSVAGLRLAGWIGSVVEPRMLALEDNLDTLAQRLPAPQLGVLRFAAHRGDDAAQLRTAAGALLAALGNVQALPSQPGSWPSP